MEALVFVAAFLVWPAIAVAVAVSRRAPLAPVLGVAVLAVGAEVLSLGLVILAGLACDESCDDRSSRWRDDPGAWQWDLIAVFAFGGALLAGAALFAMALERRRLALWALVGAVIAEGAGWVLYAS